MALLDILIYPDPRLHERSLPVPQVDDDIRALIDNMAETMYAAPGIGLAAPQVNHLKRIILVDVSDSKDSLTVFVNPQIIDSEGSEEYEEGCLSVPDIYAPVTRAGKIRVRALDRNGDAFEMDAEGLQAICIQHEIDHLDGKVFVDYLSRLKQDRIRKKMNKFTRRGA